MAELLSQYTCGLRTAPPGGAGRRRPRASVDGLEVVPEAEGLAYGYTLATRGGHGALAGRGAAPVCDILKKWAKSAFSASFQSGKSRYYSSAWMEVLQYVV
jgi:hypothetical protein